MSDRLQEIRARLDAATTTPPGANERMVWESGRMYRVEDDRDRASRALYHHAPADIAWLLDEVERLERENAYDLLEITRKASDAEDYWMREAKRLAGRVNALIDRLDFEGVSGIEKEPADA